MEMNVRKWLDSLGLGQYADTFEKNDITWETLPELDHDLLREAGVKSIGHRVALLKAIKDLGSSDVASTPEDARARIERVERERGGEAERRQLTVMFCDLAGSTALSQSMDPEDYREVLSAYQAAVSAAISEHDGYIARYMGDGVLVYFGYPTARENDPERAARAGLAVVDAVRSIEGELGLEVRVGIATGPVVVGDIVGEGASEEAAVLGETPNLAARLQGVARPNTVLIGPVTQQLVTDIIETEALAPAKLKGLSRPIVAHRVVRARTLSEVGQARLDSVPLVGREVELALLERAWRTAQSGEGQAVLLTAEPGVGKSRLLRAFQEVIREECPTRVLWYCSPYYQTTANYAAIEHLKRLLHVDEETPEESLGRLERMLAQLELDIEVFAPSLALLVSLPTGDRFRKRDLSPEETKRRLISAQTELLVATAKKSPTLFVVEDLHWADPTTLEVLGEIIEAIWDTRILVLLTARPEFSAPWSGRSSLKTYTLDHLNRQETRQLIQNIIHERGLEDRIVDQIVERTDGVPLYIEELTKNFLESGEDTRVPTSLQDSLMARLDRLGTTKELAQTASVIGRSFSVGALCAVAEQPSESVQSGLHDLMSSGLVYRHRGRGEDEYEFKHALVRDSAYGSLLRDRRRALHLRAAEVLRKDYPEKANEQPELVAIHYAAAEDPRSAIEFWKKAGHRSVQRFENAEAKKHFQAALDALESLPADSGRDAEELELVLALGAPSLATYGYAASEVAELYERARILSERLHDMESSFIAIRGLWHNLLERGHLFAARDHAEQLKTLAAATGQKTWQAASIRALGSTLFLLGEPKRALEILSEGVPTSPAGTQRVAEKYGDASQIGIDLYQAHSELLLGLPESATRREEAALEQAEAVGDPLALAFTLCFRGIHHVYRRMPDKVLSYGERALELARANDLISWEAHACITTGWAHTQLGDPKTGVERIRAGTHAWVRMGAQLMLPVWSTLLSESLLVSGDQAGALSEIDTCLSRWGDVDEAFYRAESWRVRGDVLAAARDGDSEAESSYREAARIAHQQGARLFECRAHLHLAQLLVRETRQLEAIGILESIIESLQEGFDDPDYRATSTLLEALSQQCAH